MIFASEVLRKHAGFPLRMREFDSPHSYLRKVRFRGDVTFAETNAQRVPAILFLPHDVTAAWLTLNQSVQVRTLVRHFSNPEANRLDEETVLKTVRVTSVALWVRVPRLPL